MLLLRFLDRQREEVVATAEGLSERQAQWKPDGQLLPIAGIIHHLTHAEWRWIEGRYLGPRLSAAVGRVLDDRAHDRRRVRELLATGTAHERHRPGRTEPGSPLSRARGQLALCSRTELLGLQHHGPEVGAVALDRGDRAPRRSCRCNTLAARRQDHATAMRYRPRSSSPGGESELVHSPRGILQTEGETMGKLIVTEFVTLDGVAQAPGGPDEDPEGGFTHGGWQEPLADEESGDVMFEQAKSMDALLLGRRTYEIFADYWPNAPEEIPFTGLLNGVPKYVASRTLAEPLGWHGSTLVGEPIADERRRPQGPPRRDPRHRQPRPRAVTPAVRARRPAGAVDVPGGARQREAGVRPTGPCPPRCGWSNRSPTRAARSSSPTRPPASPPTATWARRSGGPAGPTVPVRDRF